MGKKVKFFDETGKEIKYGEIPVYPLNYHNENQSLNALSMHFTNCFQLLTCSGKSGLKYFPCDNMSYIFDMR